MGERDAFAIFKLSSESTVSRTESLGSARGAHRADRSTLPTTTLIEYLTSESDAYP